MLLPWRVAPDGKQPVWEGYVGWWIKSMSVPHPSSELCGPFLQAVVVCNRDGLSIRGFARLWPGWVTVPQTDSMIFRNARRNEDSEAPLQ